MCSRYFVDDGTEEEIRALICQVEGRLEKGWNMAVKRIIAGDVHPTEGAPVLSLDHGAMCCTWQYWGFPGFQEKGMVINARCETAMEKPFFRDDILRRRVVVPAAWFYEWSPRKEKYRFRRKGQPVLFMAGCSRRYEDGEHFVIFTTAANVSVEPVHGRMPLILEREEVAGWLLEDAKTGDFLNKTPAILERETEYEQMSLFQEGGCHAQFGSYDGQKGDGEPGISGEEQREHTVRHIMEWME